MIDANIGLELTNIVLKWKPLIEYEANLPKNNYFLKNNKLNSKFYTFIRNNKNINQCGVDKKIIKVLGNMEEEEFYEFVKMYDPFFSTADKQLIVYNKGQIFDESFKF
jgi:hypothetical protein